MEIACLLYAYDLVLGGESEEDQRVMVGWFAEVCRINLREGRACDSVRWGGGVGV